MKRIIKKIFYKAGFSIHRIKTIPSRYDITNKRSLSNFVKDDEHQYDLLIVDDFLPNSLGSWRSAEMATYMKSLKNVHLLCLKSYYFKKIYPINYEEDRELFLSRYNLKNTGSDVIGIDSPDLINVNAKLGYCLFISNLKLSFPLFEKFKIPFLFTLYPGAGFRFYNKESEIFLRKINDSPLFMGVIVTQQSTFNYLIDRKIISENKIHFIYGVPYQLAEFNLLNTKRFYKKNKSTLDICFVATKYTKFGIDKGFDVFCQVVYGLAKKYDFVKFHVVGNFSSEDLLYEIPENQIKFYSFQYFEFFKEFYCNIDMILSPVKSNVFGEGSFDGFPTGAVTDAGLFNVLMVSSDPLNDNRYPDFKNWEEMIIAESNQYSISDIVEKLIENPMLIELIANAGRKKLLKLFSKENQLDKRMELIKEILEGTKK